MTRDSRDLSIDQLSLPGDQIPSLAVPLLYDLVLRPDGKETRT